MKQFTVLHILQHPVSKDGEVHPQSSIETQLIPWKLCTRMGSAAPLAGRYSALDWNYIAQNGTGASHTSCSAPFQSITSLHI